MLLRTGLAFCPDNNEVHIYKKTPQGGWEKEFVLQEHDQLVTGIDWAPKTNRIVTCSQDRNAYVWTFEDGKWQPVLVILRLSHAATSVKWSPDGTWR
jgi:actin related protein 2/3 complex subunit 1A/1B